MVKLKEFNKKKGQGTVEYAILVAAIVAIAAMLFNTGGVKNEAGNTISKTVSTLRN